METLTLYLALGTVTVAGATILSLIGLRAFHDWLELKRFELGHATPMVPTAGARIDIADLKERIRKLEAIAAGVDL